MLWGTNKISDHNRSSLSIEVERIERKNRMANGSMRKFVIADKRTFSCSWEMLPKSAAKTVDGFWGGSEIENFYNTTPGSFTLTLANADNSTSTYTVMFSDFSREIVKRGSVDFWNISVSMEEV